MPNSRVCFLTYHRADYEHAMRFTEEFTGAWQRLIDRGIGAQMAGAIVGSSNHEYIKRSIRQTYLRDSVVTIVLLGPCTWSRKFVDWEIAASLDGDQQNSGLLVLTLPYAHSETTTHLRSRLAANVESGYAVFAPYPSDVAELSDLIEQAYARRTTHLDRIDNSEPLRGRNAYCQR
ncbi:TIR domain-containing protein [Bowdeniella massiliensis]|uniref:TIR domain-containing protein n=1 Tax=Bowdeniella massiliensis TaxID=2932264 RepID=UPI002029902B|nr:TIR domain-containing protein [Bowdeniella massiliensis]